MYDYVDGKVDWMAAGLPVEGEEGPFLGEQVVDVATCDVAVTVGDVRARLSASDGPVVVLAGDSLAVGEVDAAAVAAHPDATPVLDVLRPVPSTVRPSVTVASVIEAGGGRRLLTTSEGRLLGQVVVGTGPDNDHHGHDHHGGDDHGGHDHHGGDDHGGDDHGGEDHGGDDDVERELVAVLEAVQERFGDRPPTEEELREFLRDRLIAEGRSPDDADRVLAQLDRPDDERSP